MLATDAGSRSSIVPTPLLPLLVSARWYWIDGQRSLDHYQSKVASSFESYERRRLFGVLDCEGDMGVLCEKRINGMCKFERKAFACVRVHSARAEIKVLVPPMCVFLFFWPIDMNVAVMSPFPVNSM
jgi:hypothetical protein